MNRKKFISTIAGATATSVIGTRTLIADSANIPERSANKALFVDGRRKHIKWQF